MKFLLPVLLAMAIQVSAADEVAVRLIANRAKVAKGETFLLAVHLTMKDHWHTYWENPGFAGLPTTWELNEVPGLEIGPLRFPLPKTFDEDGMVTYGYDDEALLTAQATYRGDQASFEIQGKVGWLQCKELCVPGEAKVSLVVEVGESTPAAEALFEKYLALTPMPHGEGSSFDFEAAFTIGEERWTGELTLKPRDGQVFAGPQAFSYLPLRAPQAELRSADLRQVGKNYVYTLVYEPYDTPPEDLEIEAVVIVRTESGVHSDRLLLYGPGAKPASAGGLSANPGFEAAPVISGNRSLEAGAGLSIWLILLIAFGGGMLLNLMPCVLSVLSLKVFSLMEKAGESALQRVKYAWVYTLGVMAAFGVFSAFFVASRLAGNSLGVGFHFQNVGFVTFMIVLIFILALSFMGVFEIGAPSSLRLQNLSMSAGYRGSFFGGVLMTILSTPCTAPGVGIAYGWSLTQPLVVMVIMFQVVALGLAFPYLVLCYMPSLLRFLPKPGPWMGYFKVVLGFSLMGTVVWLFAVLTDLTGKAGVVGLLSLLLFLSLASYIYGKTWFSDHRKRGLVWGSVLVLLGVYMGLFLLFDIRNPRRELHEREEMMALKYRLQESGSDNAEIFQELDAMATTPDKIAWVPYTPNALEHFRTQERIVFLDFTATWCLTCKANERFVIDTQKVRGLFADKKIVTMQADYTHKDDELTRLINSFGRAGVPLYVVYPGNGNAILLPETITAGLVTDAVDQAGEVLARRASLSTVKPVAGL